MELPKKVFINEVVLRDGLQLEKKIVSLNEKKSLFDQLTKANITMIEFGSFVHPKLVPQMANSGDLYSDLSKEKQNANLVALVPNLKGTEKAHDYGVERVNFVFSASNTHNLQNVHKSTEDSLKELARIQDFCSKQDITLYVTIATAFGCPFEGEVSPNRVKSLVEEVSSLNVEMITLADTTGMANPYQVYNLMKEVRSLYSNQQFGLHFHNTRGMGLSNILAGIQAGINSYDTALGGLGGCPFAPGATGNVCTEDVVHMLHSMGIDTGIRLEELLVASALLNKIVEHDTPSYILKAGTFDRKYPIPDSVSAQ
ncbi:hydroxymethylglutaryl-CoA lyase [Jeotgalibacillus soli]|uniref:Pyruvate carboxyltransferase domain-containing protein n=1 Tax=Jeotgalibacillus soli TaxID=889306 RepID=A0A0C2R4H0_9BACL|nr:hydroxymethylglutaryl-CoA lyase [Jeotgalibacillus soli]KIL45145.1 hypothetical protein KP78_26890 [Jeotgalibacillus soli]